MKQEEFAIVAALARSSMGKPNNAIKHHIQRLADSLRPENPDQAKVLEKILKPNEDPIVIPVLSENKYSG